MSRLPGGKLPTFGGEAAPRQGGALPALGGGVGAGRTPLQPLGTSAPPSIDTGKGGLNTTPGLPSIETLGNENNEKQTEGQGEEAGRPHRGRGRRGSDASAGSSTPRSTLRQATEGGQFATMDPSTLKVRRYKLSHLT